ncbi:Rne/Rng family ribonuclease [Brevundimonas vesicularis]|uniref:Rne/Rng family ribonuclease n=1 Tax=Brevundimonas vesicularis TaxID=41276 RepID=UPI0038D3CA30
MARTMLIDAAHAEETRVAIVDGRQVDEFDFESTARRQLRGNIYLAKVTRVEPSLQAAFVEYGGNRHGFLAFNEIHPDYYQIPVADREAIMAEASSDDDDQDELARDSDDGESEGGLADEERLKRRLMRRYKIQDVIKRRQILLVQVVKDERGAKGAALTTWLSLAGRYCVLMPNTGKGGGISRKITNTSDRRRLKSAAASLKVPQGMGLIIRTAGAKRTKAEIKRDYEYLLRMWETIRETTLKSNAPALIYEEENLVRRAVRDMYDKDFDGIQVEGIEGFKEARDFMRVLMPSQARKIHLYQGSKPLFAAQGIEEVLTQIHQPVVPLKSGGYLVINQTEALVAIDVNSGRSTKERNVEATATKTNLEAAVEAARQLRLRDLAGLIVIDFIDMDEGKNNRAVEKALKDALAKDRARIQMGRISSFGLMEISRQRRRLGVIEGATEVCQCCQGAGRIRSAESAALVTLRAVDIEAGRNGAGSVNLRVSTAVALYILNHKRAYLQRLQEQRGLNVVILIDDTLAQGEHAIERTSTEEDFVPNIPHFSATDLDDGYDDTAFDHEDEDEEEEDDIATGDEDDDDRRDDEDAEEDDSRDRASDGEGRNGRRRRRRRGGRRDAEGSDESSVDIGSAEDDEDSEGGRRRRRGRRGGRRIREDGERDAFTWVRGRTPSLEDPYVWFDPINPANDAAERSASASDAPSVEVEDNGGEQAEGERREGRSRRRRSRGRGRDRNGEGLSHDQKVEIRATNEGLPPVGSPETPMATYIAPVSNENATETAPEVETVAEAASAEAPKRRRVRRKVSDALAPETLADAPAVESSQVTQPEARVAEVAEIAAEPEAPILAAPVVLDITPNEAALVEAAIETLTQADSPAAAGATTPEVDVAALIAEDPNQIVAPPAKPKRGWWRR